MALVRRIGSVGPKSNVPEVSQPWARELEARLQALEFDTGITKRGIVTARSNTEAQATFQTIQQGMIKGVRADLTQFEIESELFREEVEQELEESKERLDEAQDALDDLNENVLPGLDSRLNDLDNVIVPDINSRLNDMQQEIDDIVVEAGGNTITYSVNEPPEITPKPDGARNLVTNPSMEATSGTVEVRRNLSTNPSFEAGLGGTLTSFGSAYLTREQRETSFGSWVAAADFDWGAFSYIYQRYAVSPVADDWWLAFKAHHLESDGTPTAVRAAYRIGTGGDWVYSSVSDRAYRPLGDPGTAQVAMLVPAAATEYQVMVYGSQGEAQTESRVMYTDAWSVGRGASEAAALEQVREYFDGSTSPDPDLTASWAGPVNGSESVLEGQRVANTNNPSTPVLHPYRSSDRPAHGSSLARFLIRTDGAANFPVGNQTTTVGETYTILGRIRGSREVGNRFRPRVGGVLGDFFTLTPEWQEFRFTAVATQSGASVTGLHKNSGGVEPGDWIDIDAAMLTEGEYDGPYADGDSTGWMWEGPPHESASFESEGDYATGDTWIQIDNDQNIIGQWSLEAPVWVPRQIDNEFIANLDAGKINAGILDAQRIGAKTISTEKLIIGSGANMIPDPTFQSPEIWSNPDRILPTGGRQGGGVITLPGTAGQNTVYLSPSNPIPVTPGGQYRFSAWVMGEEDTPSSAFRLLMGWVNFEGNFAGNGGSTFAGATPGGTWRFLEWTFTVPDTVAAVCPGFAAQNNHSVVTHYSEPSLRPMANGELIVDGAITSDKIAANSITANKLLIGDFENLFNTGPYVAEDESGWEIEGSPSFSEWTGDSVLITPASGVGRLFGGPPVTVRGTEEFYFSFPYVRTSTTGTITLYSRQRNSDGVITNTSRGTFTGSSPGELSGTYAVPSNTVSVQFYLHWTAGTTPFELGAPVVRRRMSSTLIEDGAITTGKVAADAITGNKIAAGSITANDAVFATGAIQSADIGELTADKITSGTLSAIDITGSTITGTTINGGDINGSEIVGANITGTNSISAGGTLNINGGSLNVAASAGQVPFTVTHPNGTNVMSVQSQRVRLGFVASPTPYLQIETRITDVGTSNQHYEVGFNLFKLLPGGQTTFERLLWLESFGGLDGYNTLTAENIESRPLPARGTRVRTSNLNVGGSTPSLITLNGWGGSQNQTGVTAASGGIRVSRTGLYLVTAEVYWTNNTGDRRLRIYVNGSNHWDGLAQNAGGGNSRIIYVTRTIRLFEGDLVQLYQNGSGSNTATIGTGNARLELERIHARW